MMSLQQVYVRPDLYFVSFFPSHVHILKKYLKCIFQTFLLLLAESAHLFYPRNDDFTTHIFKCSGSALADVGHGKRGRPLPRDDCSQSEDFFMFKDQL